MAQIQLPPATSNSVRPTTPPERLKLFGPPRMSPSRVPEPLVTSPSFRNGHVHLDTFSPVNQNGSFEFDRVIRSGKVLRRIKKKGAWKPSWKPAFLVLRPNLLSVYKHDNETDLKVSITLSEITAVAVVKKTNTDNVFGIFTPAKNYHFSGFSERDASDWIAVIRIEARIGQEEELSLPAPGLNAGNTDNIESETTDFSAEDDNERPGSPEMPQWSVRGNKSRSNTQTGQRKLSSLREYSANEQYTTSQSDFSDVAAGLSTSVPRNKSIANQPGKLSTIPSESPLPMFTKANLLSQTSLQGVTAPTSAQTQSTDPNRVIKQGYLVMHKNVSGVRQKKSVWVVLRVSGLSLYKSTSEYVPLKIIPIHGLIDAAEIDPISKSKPNCLQVIGEEKTWKFSVETESELEGWLGALKSVLVKKGRGLSSAHGLTSSTPSVPATGIDRGKDTAGHIHSPPSAGRGMTRTDPGGLDNIVEGVDEMKLTT